MKTRPVLFVALMGLVFCAVSCMIPPPMAVRAPRQVPPPAPVPVVIPAPIVAPPAVVPPPKVRGPVELFADIRIGMRRPAVEAMLGAPIATDAARGGVLEAWYLPAPPVTKPALPKGGWNKK